MYLYHDPKSGNIIAVCGKINKDLEEKYPKLELDKETFTKIHDGILKINQHTVTKNKNGEWTLRKKNNNFSIKSEDLIIEVCQDDCDEDFLVIRNKNKIRILLNPSYIKTLTLEEINYFIHYYPEIDVYVTKSNSPYELINTLSCNTEKLFNGGTLDFFVNQDEFSLYTYKLFKNYRLEIQ